MEVLLRRPAAHSAPVDIITVTGNVEWADVLAEHADESSRRAVVGWALLGRDGEESGDADEIHRGDGE